MAEQGMVVSTLPDGATPGIFQKHHGLRHRQGHFALAGQAERSRCEGSADGQLADSPYRRSSRRRR